jgi:anti-sigma factor RsiW
MNDETITPTDQLIARYVDGELTGQARRDFQQRLAREGELRRRVEAEQALADDLCDALRSEMDSPAGRPPAGRPARAGSVARWAALAAAAVVVIAVVAHYWLGAADRSSSLPMGPREVARKPAPVSEESATADKPASRAGEGPRAGERTTDRRVIAVMDEKQDMIYVVEVRRTKTHYHPTGMDL